jgi:hypothetical protein
METASLPIYVLLADIPPGYLGRAPSGGFPRDHREPDAEHLKVESDLYSRADQLAGEGYTVLLLRRPIEKDFSDIGLTYEDLDRDGGLRLSPMTPFALLHRMFDMMKGEDWSSSMYRDIIWGMERWSAPNLMGNRPRQEILEMGSTGVNTWAGRKGLLTPSEATSDLWAKYILTGKIAYNKDAERPGVPWGPDDLWAREDFDKGLRKNFPALLELSQGKIVNIGIKFA